MSLKVSSQVHSCAPSGGRFLTLEEINDPLASPKSPDGIIARYARYGEHPLRTCIPLH